MTSEVSCPYFEPVRPAAAPAIARAATFPLGDLWTGLCHAAADQPAGPDAAPPLLCNLGYARDECPMFPSGRGPDAVRFAIACDDGATLKMYYAVERDHHPFDHGVVEFCEPGSTIRNAPPDPILQRQARAYLESYRRRKESFGR